MRFKSRSTGLRCDFEDLDELLSHSGALDALSAIRFSSFTDPSSTRGRDNRRLLGLIEGALRLAALFHDLGHLPFSHDTEFALKDFASEKQAAGTPLDEAIREIANAKAPHEEIGHALSDIVFRLLHESKPAVRHVYSLAKKNPRCSRARLWTDHTSTGFGSPVAALFGGR